MENFVSKQIASSIQVKTLLQKDAGLIKLIANVASVVTDAYIAGNKTMLAGNGGSAADAQHIAGEFVSKFYFDRPAIPSIALSTDTSIITAIGNDYGYENLFSRQVQAFGLKGDVFIGISTSGNSPNILKAFLECKNKGITSVGLTGKSGGKMTDICDYCINVPSEETPRIQESHILIGHIICGIVEDALFSHLKQKVDY